MKDRELAESRAEIERLNSEAELFGYEYDRAYAALVRMREALEPFADASQRHGNLAAKGYPEVATVEVRTIDLHRAREALDHAPSSEKGGDAPEQPSPVVALPASADTLERAASRDPPEDRVEFNLALKIANTVLDQPTRDPDDDISVLARQILRSQERLAAVRYESRDAALEEAAKIADHEVELTQDRPNTHWNAPYATAARSIALSIRALKSQSSPPSSDVAGELLAALEVFALLTPPDSMNDPDDMPLSDTPSSVALTVGDLRRARSAIAKARALESSPVPPSTPEPEHD